MLKNPKGVPFQFFGIVRLFLEKKFPPKGGPLSIFDVLQHWMLKIRKGPPARQFGPTFGFSGTVKEYLTL